MSIKKTEHIMEEILWRYIVHNNGMDLEKSREEFKRAVENITQSLITSFESLPPADDK